ncbi:MAG: hypothetical protein CVU65_08810 [Deltaproteobacteria bacterium HGW-Deltaproteobacteria-22]|nr:MAG: hypothetical protein CVU65_08810 [Deltaproteobacteria bacterium HGW-Deltaproteobacteria-22]
MKNLRITSLLFFFLASTLVSPGCSTPPVIRNRVSAGHVQSVHVSFMGKAKIAKDEWDKAIKELATEKEKTKLLAQDKKVADLWVKIAQMQLERAATVKKLGGAPVGVKVDKSVAQLEKELEAAKAYREFTALLIKFNRKQLELLKWKIYTAEATTIEEQVLALHKSQNTHAGKYSKLTYTDQTYRVRRKFLVAEEKMGSLAVEVKTLQKQIEATWNPTLVKSAAGPASPAACKPCTPCPDAVPCPRCAGAPGPAELKIVDPPKPADPKPEVK